MNGCLLLLAKIMPLSQHQCCHGFYYGYRAHRHAGIVPARYLLPHRLFASRL